MTRSFRAVIHPGYNPGSTRAGDILSHPIDELTAIPSIPIKRQR